MSLDAWLGKRGSSDAKRQKRGSDSAAAVAGSNPSATPPDPASTEASFWECTACTLRNPVLFLCCDACGTERTALAPKAPRTISATSSTTISSKGKTKKDDGAACAASSSGASAKDSCPTGSRQVSAKPSAAADLDHQSPVPTATPLALALRYPKKAAAAQPAVPVAAAPRGLFLFHDFVSEEEEARLLHCLDNDKALPWSATTWNGTHRSKGWGVIMTTLETRYQARPPMPDFLTFVVERMHNGKYEPLLGFKATQANANDYRQKEGHWLRAHFDDRKVSGDVLANLSLAGDCYMTYTHEATGVQHKVLLPRRSLQVVTGESRYNWTHAIANEDLIDPRRVSITLRRPKDFMIPAAPK
jgi:alkylated DNA repair dioxygenase AlkB